jgi:hypothetical protein
MPLGIAGWPLRDASLEEVGVAWALCQAPLVEIPKDLLDKVSIKQLFRAVRSARKGIALAGTTDFAHLGGMGWADYSRYLEIQIAQARFLGAHLFRVFLQAETRNDFFRALDRLEQFTRATDIEIVVETHGGWESTVAGLSALLESATTRLVVDFGNISDEAAAEFILRRPIGERIAYFHLRALPGAPSTDPIVDAREARAMNVYPGHNFLWEPKGVETREALAVWRQLSASVAR